jgi:hypothetical protein
MICGHLDLEEDLERVGAVDDGRLDGFLGNAAQRRREDHHGEAGLDPDQHHHQEEVVPERDGQPGLRFAIGQRGGEKRDDRTEATARSSTPQQL